MGISWDDGGEYASAAEAAGVDVGGMLEAGMDAKQLLEFVAAFRKEEGVFFHDKCSFGIHVGLHLHCSVRSIWSTPT